MAISELSICNDALSLLGAELLEALSDDTKSARILREQYPKVRQQLISEHPWKFARWQAEMAADAELPAGHWEYDYAFSLPADCLRPLSVLGDPAWDREGDKMFSNRSPLFLKYIRDIEDTSKFDAFFAKALAHRLAQNICYSITQKAEAVKVMTALAEEAVASARSFSAQQTSSKIIEADDWLTSRL